MKKSSFSNKLLLIVTAFALILSLTTTFAWFSSRFITDPFSFTTAKLASTVKLYQALDFDLDGYPNVDFVTSTETDEQGTSTTTTTEKVKYREIFNNETKEVDGEDILYTALVIPSMLPSERYTYKLEVTNNGTVKTEMVAAFVIDTTNVPSTDTELFVNYLYTLAVTPVWLNDNGTIIEGDQLLFSQLITDELSEPTTETVAETETSTPLLTVSEATAKMTATTFNSVSLKILDTAIFYNLVKDKSGDFKLPDTMIDVGQERSFMFRIEMLPYEDVSTLMTQETYQSLQGFSCEIILSVALQAEEFS